MAMQQKRTWRWCTGCMCGWGCAQASVIHTRRVGFVSQVIGMVTGGDGMSRVLLTTRDVVLSTPLLSGTAAAAHAVALQFWQLGGVILFALSTVSPYALASSCICAAHCGLGYQVASIVVPSELARKDGGPAVASSAANRLLCWGSLLGIGLGALQLAALPMLHVFTPLAEVRRMAYVPSVLGAVLQFINGIVFVGEVHFTPEALRFGLLQC